MTHRFRRSRFALRHRPVLEALEARTVLSTFTVTSLGDSGAGSLRDAVQQANANPDSTIQFKSGLKGTIPLASELDITANMTIHGPGANKVTVSGGNVTRVFAISGSDVSIDNLTIADGQASGDTLESPLGFPVTLGGGILSNGSNLTLDRVVMTGNQAVGTGAEVAAGGAVANIFGGSLTVTRSTFSGNSVSSPIGSGGGAITSDGGSSATIDHSTFTGNQSFSAGNSPVYGASAGAVTDYGGSTMTVTSSTFDRNLAQGTLGIAGSSGGAIDCEFTGHLATESSTLIVDRCTFTGNQSIGGPVAPGVDGNQGNGGAIAIEGPGSTSATITGSTFSGNLARSADGGAGGGSANLSFGGAINNFSATLSISGSMFKDNEALGGAGGSGGGFGGEAIGGAIGSTVLVGSESFVPVTKVSSSQFVGNSATGGVGGDGADGGGARGGAIANLFGSLDMSASSLVRNTAVGAAGGDGGGSGGLARGGAIANDRGGTATIDSTSIVNNEATGGAGGSGGSGGDAIGGGISNGRQNRITGAEGSLTLINSNVTANSATGGAGGAGGNGGNGLGGGLFSGLSATTATILNTNITANQASGGAAGAGGTDGSGIGGGIYTDSSAGAVLFINTKSKVKGNKASTSDDDIFGTVVIIP
jgi:hypothetical protein